ncbi:SSI family serine proteinase inhibitor [Actinophytocola sp.]|uniref:SSI family serine proteinase inhibitor n=1 Tax=Actinophytocola sp. TaxID=1872138 RepID=UPI002D7F7F01|nr:SSI family serine proteinase inhibitor [Actinophytocola sp.]HET9144411.1 SSI family serine proteinase inhibitor [Actinophytocola sp.]
MPQLINLILGILLCTAPTPAPQPPAPHTALVLNLRDATEPNRPLLDTVTLRCDPPGGTHPDAAWACAKLREVNGDLARLRPLGGPCTFIYQPVIVEVHGTWRGHPVQFLATYENRCVARDRSAGVFRFAEHS